LKTDVKRFGNGWKRALTTEAQRHRAGNWQDVEQKRTEGTEDDEADRFKHDGTTGTTEENFRV